MSLLQFNQEMQAAGCWLLADSLVIKKLITIVHLGIGIKAICQPPAASGLKFWKSQSKKD
jgi:hypothetical protein